jgi:hypothetical protein
VSRRKRRTSRAATSRTARSRPAFSVVFDDRPAPPGWMPESPRLSQKCGARPLANASVYVLPRSGEIILIENAIRLECLRPSAGTSRTHRSARRRTPHGRHWPCFCHGFDIRLVDGVVPRSCSRIRTSVPAGCVVVPVQAHGQAIQCDVRRQTTPMPVALAQPWFRPPAARGRYCRSGVPRTPSGDSRPRKKHPALA